MSFFFKNDPPTQAPVCIPGQREETKNGGWCAVQTWLRFLKSRYRGHQRELRSGIGHVKWRRGYLPRAVREVIFVVGLNQMSDYFEELVPPRVILSDRIAVVHHHPNLTSRYVSCFPRCWGRIWSPVLLCASCFPFFLRVLMPWLSISIVSNFFRVRNTYIYIYIYVCVQRNPECANIHCTNVLPSYIDV